jgi:hypothetical protein
MANKNTMRLRKVGFAGYGEKRGSKVDTSLSNPERKSSKKTFKIRPIETSVTSEKDDSTSIQKIKKGSKTN